MANRIHVPRIIHTIHATNDITGLRLLYQDALGGLTFAENYFEAEDRDAALMYVANHMIEPMAPRTPGRQDKGFARLVSKIGECFHSFELKVENGKAASEAFQAAGCKTSSDYGFFFFVKGEWTGGVLLEVCETPMPNDPYDRPSWTGSLGTGHASSVVALDHIACVTADLTATLRFFTEVVDGEVVSDGRTELPQPGRRVLIRLGDTHVAFVQPDDPASGPLGAFLAKPQSGIYALVWQVADEQRARAHFFDKLKLREATEGSVSPGFAIDPADFFGGRHEFVTAAAG